MSLSPDQRLFIALVVGMSLLALMSVERLILSVRRGLGVIDPLILPDTLRWAPRAVVDSVLVLRVVASVLL